MERNVINVVIKWIQALRGRRNTMGLRRDLLLFPGGKKKALTFSYDDAVTQDAQLVRLMNRYGMKGTFNINTGLLGTEKTYTRDGKTVSQNRLEREAIHAVYTGHELAVHGLTHLDLALAGNAAAAYEIMADRKNLEDLTHTPVRGMAYPFGTWNEALVNLLRSCGTAYSRTTKSTGAFTIPEEFLTWNPTCHHADEQLFVLAERFFEPEQKYSGPRLFYVWGHSYEFDLREDWERMELFLEQMSGREEIWYASNIEICDYVKASRHLQYSADGRYIHNPTALDIWLFVNQAPHICPSGQTICLDRQETV